MFISSDYFISDYGVYLRVFVEKIHAFSLQK